MQHSSDRISLAEVEALVFSGGGSRCLWQAGFWELLAKREGYRPKVIAAASAGATIACISLAGKSEEGLDYFKRVTASNSKNVYLEHLIISKSVFPHYEIYRKAIHDLFSERDLERLKTGPELRIQISHPPRWLGSRSGAMVGIAAYSLEKFLRNPMHPTFPSALGFIASVVTLESCATVSDLADVLLQSSCTPPFVPVMRRNGKPALDGGLVDNVPVSLTDDMSGKVLVLLSRQYDSKSIPQVSNRVYIQPSEAIGISKWDYTDPNGLQIAYDLGKKDAEVFFRERF